MASSRWIWIGLLIAAVGWALLLCGAVAPLLPAPASRLPPWSTTSLVAIAAIFTGFAVATLAALARGFGALDRFFVAALERSARRAEAPPTMVEPASEPLSRRVVDHGFIDNSVYRVYGDGSVEVDTVLGSRRFATLQEAQAFVGFR